MQERKSGTPQGGVISPVLANLFLHYVIDRFLEKEISGVLWIRYADDGVIHCRSEKQAEYIKRRLKSRLKAYGLEMNEEKTQIVYCKGSRRTEEEENTTFDFLGYTYRARLVKMEEGRKISIFLPGISGRAKIAIYEEVRRWRLQRRVGLDIYEIAKECNRKIQG